MKFNQNILEMTRQNTLFRKEVVTGESSQVVLMCVVPTSEIGEETHHVDQALVFVEGSGVAILDDEESAVGPGSLVFVPAGTKHNFKNTGVSDLKLFTVYAPPEHASGTVHTTAAEAEEHSEE